MDDGSYDGVLVAVWAFLAGSLYGAFAYFVFGALLYGGVESARLAGQLPPLTPRARVRRRPVALSLVLWPVKLALYGEALFRTGGSDHGAGTRVFDALELGFLLWAVALLVIGVRAVHGWTWARAGAACAPRDRRPGRDRPRALRLAARRFRRNP